MLYSIFKILILLALFEFVISQFILSNKKHLPLKSKFLLIIRAGVVCFSIFYLSMKVYILKYGNFNFCLDWQFILNDIKNNTIKYVFTLFVISVFSFMVNYLYEFFKFLIGEISNRFIYKFDEKSSKWGRLLLLKKSSHDGFLNIKKNKIVIDKNSQSLKEVFKDVSFNALVPSQALTTTSILLLLVFIFFIPTNFMLIFTLLVLMLFIYHLIISLLVNSYIRSLKDISKLL